MSLLLACPTAGKRPSPGTGRADAMLMFQEPNAAYSFGLTAWRLLNEEPHVKLSVVSDNIVAQANDKFKFYIPFTSTKKLVSPYKTSSKTRVGVKGSYC